MLATGDWRLAGVGGDLNRREKGKGNKAFEFGPCGAFVEYTYGPHKVVTARIRPPRLSVSALTCRFHGR